MIAFADCIRHAHRGTASAGLMMCVALFGCSETPDGVDGSPQSEAGSSDALAEADVGNADADVDDADASVDTAEADLRSSDARPDTRLEGGGEAGDGDAHCSQDPVWNAASLSFTYTTSGGFVPRPPPDAGCSIINMRYDFVSTDRTLVQRGCEYTGAINRRAYLTETQYDAIVANVGSLRMTCFGAGCGADYPTVVLTVSASGVQQRYNSNFYAGCAGSTVLPPFISFGALDALHSLLHATMNAACNPDAGTSDAEANDSGDANAGSCVALPNEDSGVGDAGGDA